jgi:YVTN family beta-propeller protein
VLVTFLFSDVEGSTELLRRLGGEYPAVLSRYESLVREACERHGGHVVDTQGDSVFAAFPSGGGLDAAADAQRALAAATWPEGVTLRARMGVHSGEAEAVNGRYAGLAVHRAARIGSAAHGGQVLVSGMTKELADDLELPHSFRDLGAFPLKDFTQPVRLFQLTLDGLPSDFPPPRTGEPEPEPEVRRGRRLILAGAVLSVLVAVLLAVLVLRDEDPGGLPGLSAPNSVGVIDPDTNTLVDEVPVGIRPTAITTGEGAVWVVNYEDQTVSKIDPETHRVVKTVAVTNASSSIAAGGDGVWTVSEPRRFGSWRAVRIEPEAAVKVAQTRLPGVAQYLGLVGARIAIGFGSVWAYAQGHLSSIDTHTNTVTGESELETSRDLEAEPEALWNLGFGDSGADALNRIDPDTRSVALSVPIDSSVDLALGPDAVWVVSLDGFLYRVVPATGTVVARIRVGAGASGVAADDKGVWVANGGETTVMRVDPKTNKVVATIELGIRPDKIAVGEGAVWVTAY